MITPVNVDALEQILHETGYNPDKSRFLVQSFRDGFDIGYRGDESVKLTSPNL